MTTPTNLGTLEQAFRIAAGELGLCDAAWRFVDEIDRVGGPELVDSVREGLGRTFPVMDAVFNQRLAGQTAPTVDTTQVVEACRGLKRLVVVGIEARWLDSLFEALPQVEFAVLPSSALPADHERLTANLPPRVRLVGFDGFQRYAGPRSGMLTFVYGASASVTFVLPEWARIQGPDVRAQFRSFIGWSVLDAPPNVYPRWLIEISRDVFTDLVT